MGKIIGCVTLLLFSGAMLRADEFRVVIKKVDGDKITFTKVLKGKKNKNTPAEEMTLTAIKDCKVVKGTYDKATKTFTAGDAIEGGLTASIFSSPTPAQLTTDDSGKVTQVLVIQKKKGKKKST